MMRRAVCYNCACFWTRRWKHPIATHSALFCTDVTSTKGEAKEVWRFALLWWRDSSEQRKRHSKPAKESLSHSDI